MSTRDELLRPALLINYLQSGGAERLVKDLAIEMQGYEGIGKSSLNSKRMEVIHEMIGAEKLCVRSSRHHYTETEEA